jgi:hypothetical protein
LCICDGCKNCEDRIIENGGISGHPRFEENEDENDEYEHLRSAFEGHIHELDGVMKRAQEEITPNKFDDFDSLMNHCTPSDKKHMNTPKVRN